MSRRFQGIFCVVLGGLILLHWAYQRHDAWRSGALTQEVRAVALPELKAPVVSAATESGEGYSTATLSGKPFLISFWATWCPPCAEEMPSFLRFAALARSRGVEVLAVSADKNWADVKRFFAHRRMGLQAVPMTLLLDSQSSAARSYGTDKLPETYLVDSMGIIVRKFVGAQDWDSQEALKWLASVR